MALDAYVKTCGKNVAGNFKKIYFGLVTDITAATVTSGEITAITNSTKFKEFVAEIDSVQFKYDGSGTSNYFTTQTLVMKFAKKTKTIILALEELKTAVTCGIAAIHIDGNGLAWLSGYDGEAVDPTARPFNKMKVTFDSGTKPSDADGNMITVELTRESEWLNHPFNTTLSDAIIAKTSPTATDFITYNS